MSASPAGFLYGVDTLQEASFVITPAQFKAMDNTAANSVLVIPGVPGKITEIWNLSCNMQFPAAGGIAYATGTGNLGIHYRTGGGALVLITLAAFTTEIKLSTSLYCMAGQFQGGADINPTQGRGTDVVMALTTATLYTAGNSPFVIKVRFRQQPFI